MRQVLTGPASAGMSDELQTVFLATDLERIGQTGIIDQLQQGFTTIAHPQGSHRPIFDRSRVEEVARMAIQFIDGPTDQMQ